MSNAVVKLDVREDIRNGREPFSRIMQAVAALNPGEDLLVVAPFEPAPLIQILGRQGFAHQSKSTAAGDWEVLFTCADDTSLPAQPISSLSSTGSTPVRGACAGPPVIEVDARGLEPPQPMVKILEALGGLPGGACLRARTDRRPMHLYPELEARGFIGETEEQADGSFVTHVHCR